MNQKIQKAVIKPDMTSAEARVVKRKIESARQKKRAELPHLYGFKWYKWAREFFETKNQISFLTGGNQISKSSSNIRKAIEYATNKELWKKLWPKDKQPPRQFWYFYPDAATATSEFEKKWVPEFMPRGDMQVHPVYGWKAEYKKKEIDCVHFNSGVTIYFKYYSQAVKNLQSATLHACFIDEECPEDYYDELAARLSSTDGYFSMVFTATRGQMLWYRTMERIGYENEAFKGAHKQVVSLYDCQFYEDGTPGAWSLERIKKRESECSSEAEVQKRVYGRFVKDDDLRFPHFQAARHFVEPYPISMDWRVYAAVDVGSGRKAYLNTHPSAGAIVFLAVNPQYTKAAVFKIWRGDEMETSAGDILDQYRRMRAGISVTQACYDYASKEFGLISSRASENFIPADKGKFNGINTLNALFKHGMLDIFDTEDGEKMCAELMTAPAEKNRKIQDDLTDALRYCVLQVPWDWGSIQFSKEELLPVKEEGIVDRPLTDTEKLALQIRERRGEMEPKEEDGWIDIDHELTFWNEMYGN